MKGVQIGIQGTGLSVLGFGLGFDEQESGLNVQSSVLRRDRANEQTKMIPIPSRRAPGAPRVG